MSDHDSRAPCARSSAVFKHAFIATAHQDDTSHAAAAAQPPQQLDAVDVRHHQIHHDEPHLRAEFRHELARAGSHAATQAQCLCRRRDEVPGIMLVVPRPVSLKAHCLTCRLSWLSSHALRRALSRQFVIRVVRRIAAEDTTDGGSHSLPMIRFVHQGPSTCVPLFSASASEANPDEYRTLMRASVAGLY